MDSSLDPHSYRSHRSKHDSFLSPSSHDAYGYSRNSRSSTRLDVPSSPASMSRNKSVHERERRPYHHEADHRSRSSVRREETFPASSKRARSSRRTHSWPPAPSVEDEEDALSKEHPRRRNSKEQSDEVCMPGTVDQNPVLIELESNDRRFVLVPQDGPKADRPAHPNRRRSARPELKVETDEPQLFDRRQPSPYAFTRTSQTPSNGSTAELQPPPSTTKSRTSSSTYTARPNYDREPKSKNSSSSSDERQTDDSDVEPAAVARLRDRKPKPRVSFNEPTSSPRSRPPIKRFSSDYTSPTSGGTGTLKSAMKSPRSVPSSDDEKPSRGTAKTPSSSSRPIPVPVPIPQHVLAESIYSGRPATQDYAEQVSGAEARSIPPPPGSPKITEKPSSGDYYTSSRRSSRPSSPATPVFESRDFADAIPRSSNSYINGDRPNGLNYERPNKDGPPLAPLSRHASLERPFRPRGDIKISVPSALPYPIDDNPMVQMPNHEHYIDTPTTPTAPPESTRSGFGGQNFTESPIESPNTAKRPILPSRPRTTSNVASTSQKQGTGSGSLTLPTSLPICPRMEYSKKYDDWYTLRNDQSLDICPTCLDGIVWPTPFRVEFVPTPHRSTAVRTRCDFASPWIRLAWILTLKRQRQDLDLIYAMAAIASADSPCPDTRDGVGPWYGLVGPDGQFVSGFTICSCDVNRIEACFPSLIGLFTRMPVTGRDTKMCSMRISGKRFPTYVDLLEDIDDEARSVSVKSSLSLQHLFKVIRADLPKKKCPRDNRIRETTWHFMEVLPDFTVCEECFDEVIWPTVKQGSEVANKFTKVLTPLPPGVGIDGASCQLYSSRMRKVWDRSVRYGEIEGMAYLARKVRERKEVEEDLRRDQKEISKLLDRNKKLGGSTAALEKERLKKELGKIEQEWAEWE